MHLMKSIESHKENSDFKGIDKSIIVVERFITTYSIIDKATKIGKDIEEKRHIIYELMNTWRLLHSTFRQYMVFSNIYRSFTKMELFQGHHASLNKFHRMSS